MKNITTGLMFGKFPAEILSYEPETRECIIKLPTGDAVPAEIQYPIGDKSANGINTEIYIEVGDMVWCEFIQGDTRRALITGWRNPQIGNEVGTRRFFQKNIELIATQSIKMVVGSSYIQIQDGLITMVGDVKHDGNQDTSGNITSGADIKADGEMKAAIDVKAGAISLTVHSHTVLGGIGSDVSPPK